MQSTMHSCIFVLVKSIAPAVTPWFLATPQAEGVGSLGSQMAGPSFDCLLSVTDASHIAVAVALLCSTFGALVPFDDLHDVALLGDRPADEWHSESEHHGHKLLPAWYGGSFGAFRPVHPLPNRGSQLQILDVPCGDSMRQSALDQGGIDPGRFYSWHCVGPRILGYSHQEVRAVEAPQGGSWLSHLWLQRGCALHCSLWWLINTSLQICVAQWKCNENAKEGRRLLVVTSFLLVQLQEFEVSWWEATVLFRKCVVAVATTLFTVSYAPMLYLSSLLLVVT